MKKSTIKRQFINGALTAISSALLLSPPSAHASSEKGQILLKFIGDVMEVMSSSEKREPSPQYLEKTQDKGMEKYRNKDYQGAFKNFQITAPKGSAEAQFHLGLLYDMGWGVTQDYAEAKRWYGLAADQKLELHLFADQKYMRDYNATVFAKRNLGLLYTEGAPGLAQDYAKAASWFRKAADQGENHAQYRLGDLYKNGLGVEKDLAEAARWFQLAANQGNADAQKALAEVNEQLKQGATQEATEATE